MYTVHALNTRREGPATMLNNISASIRTAEGNRFAILVIDHALAGPAHPR